MNITSITGRKTILYQNLVKLHTGANIRIFRGGCKISLIKRGGNKSFNGVELELTWQDIDDLEVAVKERQLPATTGFFFGDNNDEYYEQRDLEFIKKARAELFCGLKVFYNSSW